METEQSVENDFKIDLFKNIANRVSETRRVNDEDLVADLTDTTDFNAFAMVS